MAGQDHREQFCALNAMDCDPIIEATSVPGYRSQFAYATKLLALGDTLVVPTLSQVAPSITELLHLLREHFYLNGINLNILTGPCGGQYRFDGTDLSGPLLLAATEIAVVLRRDLVASRTMNGLRIAQLKGRRGGRPLAMSEDLIAEAVARHREGESVASIARNLHVARSTLYRMLKMDKP
jgi:DNA invertase Pin-like site-specific DNA recombinase